MKPQVKSCLTLALFFAFAAIAWCQPCSNADFRGVYLFQTSGHVNMKDLGPGLPDLLAPMAGLGLVEYDGNGNASGRFTGTWGGIAGTWEFVDFKYTVNNDCTGTAEYKAKSLDTGQVIGPDRHKILILEDGNLVRCLMVSAPGRTIINVTELRRVARGRRACDRSMIHGPYSVHYQGWVNAQALDPRQPASFAPAIGLGLGRIDPDSPVTGTATHIWGGVRIDTETVSASLKVNADCTGTMEHTIRNKNIGALITSKGPLVVLNNGEQFVVLNAEAPAFVYYTRTGLP